MNEGWASKKEIDYGRYADGCVRPDERLAEGIASAMQALRIDHGAWVAEPKSSILRGKGAEFHVDHGFGEPVALFCVMAIDGDGDFFMPNLGVRVPFRRGTTILFDPTELHGITTRGGNYAGDAPFICMTRDVQISLAAATNIGIAGSHRGVRFDTLSLCRTSGSLKRKRAAAAA
jgi:hypothetical protein